MVNFRERLSALKQNQAACGEMHQPVFLRLDQSDQKETFFKLLSDPRIVVCDFMSDQIKELLKCTNPGSKFTETETQENILRHLGNRSLEDYGVWVYYPWSNRLVHILDEEEFITVRTSRNLYKITPEERNLLAKKKIGVIGLSVGQSVSVTLAMERICGELRLADFDLLELTNLNRIRTGLHNLGLAKVYSVAREIVEIDPFIKVVCYPQGLHEKNLDQFFTEGGKLDLLVEESDGFDIKILSRYKARELKVPVIMEGSDRCTVDVERFDLEPDRSILHGLVDHLDVKLLKGLKTNEEKIPYLVDILGIETSSLRLKASMLEIDQSIGTWPQLASSVTMGGGITADVSRRMLLNQYTESGRYHVDIEELIGNRASPKVKIEDFDKPAFNYSLAELEAHAWHERENERSYLSRQEVSVIVEAGCKAPSGGNFQPWRWVYKHGVLFLFNGIDAANTLLGYNNVSSYLALGAAAENVCLKASQLKYHTRHTIFSNSNNKLPVMMFQFFASHDVPYRDDTRIKAIDIRLTNRTLGPAKTIESPVLAKLSELAGITDGVELKWFTDRTALSAIGEVLGEIEKLRLLERQGHHEFVNEIRWTEEENNLKRDGVDIRTLDVSNSERVGLEMAREPNVIALLKKWKGGGAFKKLTKKAIDSAGAIGIVSIVKNDRTGFLKAGMAVERVWLEANAAGISLQPLSASVFLYLRLLHGKGLLLSPELNTALRVLRSEYQRVLKIDETRHEAFIFRLCYAREPAIRSLRKPLEEVFYYSGSSV